MSYPVISLFSGAMGLDLGLEKAGFEVKVAVECDKYAVETIKKNRPDLPVIHKKIEDVSTEEILEKAGLKVGEVFLVVGGPSCQSFSTAGSRLSINDERGSLFRHFLRVVKEAQPKFFLMENVKGILSAAVSHRPLNQRGPGYPPLKSMELLGSAFTIIAKEISEIGAHTVFDLLNSADYGSPQQRNRVFFIGSLEKKKLEIPSPTHSSVKTENSQPWRTLRDAIEDISNVDHDYINFSPSVSNYIHLIPEGGNWKNLPEDTQKKAVGDGVYRSWGGRTGFLRRLAWDKPSPALTTSPISRATLFAHPKENRPLSVQEYSRIQEFPDNWVFAGSANAKYKQIGNAVPVSLGKALGEAILKAHDQNIYAVSDVKTIFCSNNKLLNSLKNRNLTQLNPPQMNGITEESELIEWSKKSTEWLKSHESPEDCISNYISSFN